MSWLHAVIDVPADRLEATQSFWSRALGWPVGDPWPGHPELRSLEPPDGDAYVHLQRLGTGDARVHLDLDADDVPAEVRRLTGLGALPGATEDDGVWQQMTSPGGLPFCVCTADPARTRPAGVDVIEREGSPGVRDRLVQVCIDAPQNAVDVEIDFWRAALGGCWQPSTSEGLIGKVHLGAGSTMKVLFQRLDEPTGPVRAHLDVGTTDVERDAARLEALGAARVQDRGGWVTLTDPAGLDFCTTGNDPDEELT